MTEQHAPTLDSLFGDLKQLRQVVNVADGNDIAAHEEIVSAEERLRLAEASAEATAKEKVDKVDQYNAHVDRVVTHLVDSKIETA